MILKMFQIVLVAFILWLIPSWIIKASILWLFIAYLISKV